VRRIEAWTAAGALALAAAALATGVVIGTASGSDDDRGNRGGIPSELTWTTIFKSPRVIEGLTTDGRYLYVADRGGVVPCNVLRIDPATGTSTVVGFVRTPCSPSGLAFDASGRLYVTGVGAGDEIDVLTPDASAPPTSTLYATGVPGANGLAFDRDGNLWTGDGGTGLGRVWRIPSGGGAGVEVFRVQPMANDLPGTNVGRDVRTLPPGTINPANRSATNTLGSQGLVANGVAFTRDGELLVADTARGAIWQVDLDRRGNLLSPVGCDTTFPPDTLCLDSILVQHPLLEGSDGIALDREGQIWAAANERNALAVVGEGGRTTEAFRNPPGAAQLRNAGPLEFPTSPVFVEHTLCVTQSDNNRRDNSPNAAGEVANGSGPFQAKISCADQRFPVAGLTLPVG
jgi:sugar lactone lactonase YvrE